MMKISLDNSDVNQSGTSLPRKRAQAQLSNDVGPSQIVSDNSLDDDDDDDKDEDGPPPKKKKQLSQTAVANEISDKNSPRRKTLARPRRQAQNAQKAFENGNQVDLDTSKTPKKTPKNRPIPRSVRNRPAIIPTAASARSSRRTGPTSSPHLISGDSIPSPSQSERLASAHSETANGLLKLPSSSSSSSSSSSFRSPETVITPDLATSTQTSSKLNSTSQTSKQSSDQDGLVSIYGGDGGDGGRSSGRSYWLMKAEPESRVEKGVDVKFSIDDLKDAKEPEPWDARNCMEEMKKGDLAFFYHSNCKRPGIVGIMEIVQEHSIDQTANDPAHPYYDDRNRKTKNWVVVHVKFRAKFKYMVGLKELQDHAAGGKPLANMQVLRQKRLSVSRVSAEEWRFVLGLADAAAAADADAPARGLE